MEPRRWVPFLVAIFIIGVILQEPLFLVVTTMVGVVLAIAYWWQKRSLDAVIYRRKPFYRRAFPGEKVDIQIEVENKKILPISWLRVNDFWPQAIGPEDESRLGASHIPQVGLLTNIFSLRWYEKLRRNFTLVFRQRGVYKIGPARLESGDIFGFYETAREDDKPEFLTVFPTIVPFEEIPFPTDDPFGELTSHRRLYEDPNLPMGIREYRPEDDFRRVHWPATARTGDLQSKVFQPVSARVVVLCLNISTYSRHWEGTNRALLEHVIGVAAGLVTRGVESGYRIGMISNGCLTNSDQPFRIPPGNSTRHLASLLEALAGATPLITSPFARFLMREVPRLSYGATLMIVTSVTSPELLETLIRLRKHGRRIMLISLAAEAPPEIPGLWMVHAPFDEAARVGAQHPQESSSQHNQPAVNDIFRTIE